jgi:hypothetical protein
MTRVIEDDSQDNPVVSEWVLPLLSFSLFRLY